MDDTKTPLWDCRWPDPVALQVAAERLLQQRDPEDPGLNRKVSVLVRPDPPEGPDEVVSVLLASPWAVERIYWSAPPGQPPPILHAAPLDVDQEGRVAAGQGVMLELERRTVPVLIAWEPETGHHFVETLCHSVRDFHSSEEALQAVQDDRPPPIFKKSLSQHMEKKISRRGLFGFLDRRGRDSS